MTTEHTPPPWRVNPKAGEVRGADWNVIVADVFPVGGDVSVRDANARLIAAAPDLLAACEKFIAAFNGDGAVISVVAETDHFGNAYEAIEAAIAKAKRENNGKA